MIEVLLSLPTLVGGPIFAALAAVLGLTVYYGTFRLYARRQDEDGIREIRDATGNLFRVVGWLFTLLLSLTFTDVVGELAVTETAVEREASAIQDIHRKSQRLNVEETRELRNLLIDYTQAVVKEEWPALADDRLSEQADKLLRQIEVAALQLVATGSAQETLRSMIISDVELISDYRLSRLQQAMQKPSRVLIVVILGYLVTMVLFGIYEPRRVLLRLLALYALFVGVVIYLILASSNPFHGAMAIETAPLEYVLESMRGGR